MKKIHILLFIFAIVVGCSKSCDISGVENMLGQVISFRVNDKLNTDVATRGTTLDSIDPLIANGFYVSAAATDDDDDDDNKPNDPKHVTVLGNHFQNMALTWKPGDNLTFNAFYPTPVLGVYEVAARGAPNITYTMSHDVIDNIDIVAAKTTSVYTATPVTLNFNHITSGLKFCLVDASSGGMNLSISEIAFHGLTTKATYDVSSQTWNSADASTSLAIESKVIRFAAGRELKDVAHYPSDKTQAFSIMKTETEAMFFPQQNEGDLSDLVLFIAVQITVGGKTQQSVVRVDGTQTVEAGQTLAEVVASIQPGEMLELTLKYDQFTAAFVIQGQVIPWTKKIIWFPNYE